VLKAEFPFVPVLVRAIDRRHSIDLIHAEADLQVRETFESAVVLGAAALKRLGTAADDISEITARIRGTADDPRRLIGQEVRVQC
jgi:glutathione-regulated potassium-efflux system protein KefB